VKSKCRAPFDLLRRLLAGITLDENAQLPAELPALVAAQTAAAEERAASPHALIIDSFFELQVLFRRCTLQRQPEVSAHRRGIWISIEIQGLGFRIKGLGFKIHL